MPQFVQCDCPPPKTGWRKYVDKLRRLNPWIPLYILTVCLFLAALGARKSILLEINVRRDEAWDNATGTATAVVATEQASEAVEMAGLPEESTADQYDPDYFEYP